MKKAIILKSTLTVIISALFVSALYIGLSNKTVQREAGSGNTKTAGFVNLPEIYSSDYSDLEYRIDDLEFTIRNLEGEISDLEYITGRVDDLEWRIGDLESLQWRIDDLESKVRNLQWQVDDLEFRVGY